MDNYRKLVTYALFTENKRMVDQIRLESNQLFGRFRDFMDIFEQLLEDEDEFDDYDFTETAQDAVHHIHQMFQNIKEDLKLLEKIEENFSAIFAIMKDDFPASKIELMVRMRDTISKRKDILSGLLKDLTDVRDMFPYDNQD